MTETRWVIKSITTLANAGTDRKEGNDQKKRYLVDTKQRPDKQGD